VEAETTAAPRHPAAVAEPPVALAAMEAADPAVAALPTAAVTTNTTIFPRPGRVSFLSGLFFMSSKPLLSILLLAAAPLFAHHSISAHYFTDQNIHLEGEVLDFSYSNPHSVVHLEAKDPKTGQTAKWEIEWASVRRLEARGVAKDAIKPGDHIIVEGYPSRDNLDHRLFMRGITRPSDGWKSGKDIK